MSYKRMMTRKARREQQNKLNAQQSTGPVTPEGKEISSRNAATHGLTGKKLTLSPEGNEKFQQLLVSFADVYRPATEAENSLLRHMVEHLWRLERANNIERALFDRTVAEIAEEHDGISYDEALAVVFIDPRYTKRLSLFMRYKGQIDRAYRKALAELEKLVKARLQSEAAQAESSPDAAPISPEINIVPEDGFVSSNATPGAAPEGSGSVPEHASAV